VATEAVVAIHPANPPSKGFAKVGASGLLSHRVRGYGVSIEALYPLTRRFAPPLPVVSLYGERQEFTMGEGRKR
jgi:hypothetical protein